MRIVAEVGDLVQRIEDGRTGRVLCGRVIERLGDAVCGMQRARGDEEHGFPSLNLKTDSSGLVIWVLKSLRRFLGLCLKTKQHSVCRLRHKTDGGWTTRDTHRDLAACFA
jgi:hypothetical protein